MIIAKYIDNIQSPETQQLPTAIIIDNCSYAVLTLQRWQELHPDEDWREYVAPEPTAEEIATQESARKTSLLRAISNAAREYIEEQANSALQDQLYRNVTSAAPHPMAVAVMRWGSTIAMEAENRKGQVMADLADDQMSLCDFSSFGDKPYTVYQLYLAGVIQFF